MTTMIRKKDFRGYMMGISDISADFVQGGAYFPVLRINHKWFLHDIIYSVSPVLSSLAWDWIRNPSRR